MEPLRPLPEVPASRRFDWHAVEAWLVEGFAGRRRRSGEATAYHSIRVGRALRDQHASPATVLAGYLHDAGEDLALEPARLAAVARSLLGLGEIAAQAARLVAVVSYSAAEYGLPRTERKRAAAARWLADDDLRVALIKLADIDDNDADADIAGAEFAVAYRDWALPLRAGLAAKLGPTPDGGTFTYHLLDDRMPFRVFYRERLKAGAQAPDRTLGLLRWQNRFSPPTSALAESTTSTGRGSARRAMTSMLRSRQSRRRNRCRPRTG